MELTMTKLNQLAQIFNGATWDGDLISKQDAQELADLGYIKKVMGYNIITRRGVVFIVGNHISSHMKKCETCGSTILPNEFVRTVIIQGVELYYSQSPTSKLISPMFVRAQIIDPVRPRKTPKWTKWHAVELTDAVFMHTVCGKLVSVSNTDIETASIDDIDADDICKRCLNPCFLE